MDNEFRIVEHLARHHDEEFTLRALSERTGIPYATLHRTMPRLSDVTATRRKGSSRLTSIRFGELAKARLVIASHQKRSSLLDAHPAFERLTRADAPVLVFGSYATGEQTADSDVDVLVIDDAGKLPGALEEFAVLAQKTVNPITLTTQEFETMINAGEENLAKQALREHVLLAGIERFWEAVMRAAK